MTRINKFMRSDKGQSIQQDRRQYDS